MTYILVLFGIMILSAGIYFLHHQDKTTHFIKRISAVSVTMFGAWILWFMAASNIPPSLEVKVKVEAEFQEGMVVSFVANNSRSCKIEKVDVDLVTKDGKDVRVQSELLYSGRTGTDDLGFIFIKNPAHFDANTVKVKIKHFCPFGFELQTELHSIKLEDPIKQLQKQELKPNI